MTHPPIEISETEGVRYLHLGSEWIQGAMRIARPWSLELAYIRDMMLPLILSPVSRYPRHCLCLGLGAAAQAKFIHRWFPDTMLTVVEINPAVVMAAHQFFKLPHESERLEIIIADAATWIGEAPHSQFDLILLDAFGAKGLPPVLNTPEFYQACRNRLAPQGWFACNLFSSDPAATKTRQKITRVFSETCLPLAPCASGNQVLLATPSQLEALNPALLQEHAALLKARTRLNLEASLARLFGTQAPLNTRKQAGGLQDEPEISLTFKKITPE